MGELQQTQNVHDGNHLTELTERTKSGLRKGILAWHKAGTVDDVQLDEYLEMVDQLTFSSRQEWQSFVDGHLFWFGKWKETGDEKD